MAMKKEVPKRKPNVDRGVPKRPEPNVTNIGYGSDNLFSWIWGALGIVMIVIIILS